MPGFVYALDIAEAMISIGARAIARLGGRVRRVSQNCWIGKTGTTCVLFTVMGRVRWFWSLLENFENDGGFLSSVSAF